MTNAGATIEFWIAEVLVLTLGWHPPISNSKLADLDNSFQARGI
jgi:hypothetical protein